MRRVRRVIRPKKEKDAATTKRKNTRGTKRPPTILAVAATDPRTPAAAFFRLRLAAYVVGRRLPTWSRDYKSRFVAGSVFSFVVCGLRVAEQCRGVFALQKGRF